MKFRLYQLFYLATLVLSVVALFEPIMNYIEPSGEVVTVTNFSMTAEDGSSSSAVVALGVLLIVIAAINMFALLVSMFSNFELLKRCTIFSMLVLAGYYIMVLIYSLTTPGEASVDMEAPILFPFVGLAFNAVAFTLVRRREAKIVSQALGFRLRD